MDERVWGVDPNSRSILLYYSLSLTRSLYVGVGATSDVVSCLNRMKPGIHIHYGYMKHTATDD